MKEAFKNLKNGYNEMSMDANELSAGIYFYKVSTGNSMYEGKITLIK
ncbi:MAG: T9SS type A sorting domain-containing protein [bacterium]